MSAPSGPYNWRRNVWKEAYYSLRWIVSSIAAIGTVFANAPWWAVVPPLAASLVWFGKAQNEGTKP